MVQHSFSDPAIKSTKNTKTYRKPSIENIVVSKPEPPNPAPGNETIIEGNFYFFNIELIRYIIELFFDFYMNQ